MPRGRSRPLICGQRPQVDFPPQLDGDLRLPVMEASLRTERG